MEIDRKEVKALIKRKHYSLSGFALALGYSHRNGFHTALARGSMKPDYFRKMIDILHLKEDEIKLLTNV